LFSVGKNFQKINNEECTTEIKQIDFFKYIFVSDVACGRNHILTISNKGEIFSWGDNEFGQIGNGKISQTQLIPVKIFKI
jgi:alpha-tubulin suppressor-like RCC1 family protein